MSRTNESVNAVPVADADALLGDEQRQHASEANNDDGNPNPSPSEPLLHEGGSNARGDRKSKRKKIKTYLSTLTGGGGDAKQNSKQQRPTLTRSMNNGQEGSISRMYASVSGSISRGLGVIKEDVTEAAEDIKDAFVSELHEADRGDTYFLDTNLTRALSVLPEELADFVEEATGIEVVLEEEVFKPDIEQPPVHARAVESVAWPFLSLLSAVVAVSSNGSALSLLRGVAPPMKLYWRMTATAVILSIFAIRTILRDGRPKLTRGQWMTFVAAVVCFSLQTLLFFVALEYTSIGNAVIYANSQAVILLMGKACVGEQVVLMEGCGALLAFVGAILCSKDSEGSSEDGEHALWGDGLAFLSATFGVGYLTFAKAVRPRMNVTVFMFLVMFTGSFLVLAFMASTSTIQISFTTNPYHGLFGWLSWRADRLLVELWIVLVCNIVGTMGFLRAMQHFDNITIAVATLLEPMIASVIAYELKVGVLPGALGWVGNTLVMAGMLGVVYPSVNKGGGAH